MKFLDDDDDDDDDMNANTIYSIWLQLHTIAAVPIVVVVVVVVSDLVWWTGKTVVFVYIKGKCTMRRWHMQKS